MVYCIQGSGSIGMDGDTNWAQFGNLTAPEAVKNTFLWIYKPSNNRLIHKGLSFLANNQI